MKTNYKHTVYACFLGYIVQAVINNFAPLLFLTFQTSYNISLTKITMLVTFNFILQLCIDLLSAGFIDKLGYRLSMIMAHVLAAIGLFSLTVFPEVFPDPFAGLLVSVMIYALGGGLLEVLVSPVVEACPTDNKESTMGLLHSFYCWGHVGVVLLSTIFFTAFGIQNWKALAVCWAALPLINAVIFKFVPIASLIEEGEKGFSFKELIHKKLFWTLLLLMMCAGACEHVVAQWASAFAEQGLGVSKTIGDLAGPMLFAVAMGSSRVFYSKYGDKYDLNKYMLASAGLCIISYLLISLSPFAVLGFLGCGLCGISVGVLWPGTFSLAAKTLRKGGTLMFALLALAGDLGCSAGPTLVGTVSSVFGNDLKIGIGSALIFPLLLIAGLILNAHTRVEL